MGQHRHLFLIVFVPINNNFYIKMEDFSKIPTQIVGVRGEPADHLITGIVFLNETKIVEHHPFALLMVWNGGV